MGLWADPQPVPPWEWRKWAGLCLGVSALRLSLLRSQRDTNFGAKIIFIPVHQIDAPPINPQIGPRPLHQRLGSSI
jgi:hypothetical protein